MDSRIYLQPRLTSNTGYDLPRQVLTSLAAKVPRFEIYAGSIVCQNGVFYEVWSMNSKRQPYCSGLPSATEKPNYPFYAAEIRLRRFDGHIGPYDSSVSPQLLDREHPWRVLILREGEIAESSRPEPEFIDFSAVWISEDSRTGKLHNEVIDALSARNDDLDSRISACESSLRMHRPYWSSRPWYPKPRHITLLKDTHTYETVVDNGVAIQRGIKEKDAWLRFVDLSGGLWDLCDDRELGEVPAANDNYMGCWINGTTQNEALWLMAAKVPCFIVHKQIIQEAPYGLPEFQSFATLPEILPRLSSTKNSYEAVAMRNEAVVHPIPEPAPVIATANDPTLEEMQSSSSAQGWCYGDPFPRPPAIELPSSPYAWEPELWRASSEPQFLPKLPYVFVAEKRVLWVRSPSVRDVGRWKEGGSRKWEKWLEVPVEEIEVRGVQMCLMAQGYCFRPMGDSDRDRIRGKTVCYDREKMRMLVLSSDEPPYFPAGVLKPSIFGGPLANTHFFPEATAGVSVADRGASTWIYLDREPKDENVQAWMKEPTPSMLPSLSSLPESLRAYELIEHTKCVLIAQRRTALLGPDVPPGTLSNMTEAERFRFLEKLVPGRIANIFPDGFTGRRPPSPPSYAETNIDDDQAPEPPVIFRVPSSARLAFPFSSRAPAPPLSQSSNLVPDSTTEDELSPSPSEERDRARP